MDGLAIILSVAEQRILLACISQVRRDQPITDEVMYSVSAQDIAELSEIDSNTAYRDLKEAALRLKRREIRIELEPNGKSNKDLKKRVIEPAVAQINEHSDLWVKWDQRKTGRNVTHLRFTFGLKVEAAAKPHKRVIAGDMINGVSKAEIEAKAYPGETYSQAAERLKRQADKKKERDNPLSQAMVR